MPARKVSEQPPVRDVLWLLILVIAAIWYFNRSSAPNPAPEPDKPVPGPVEPVTPAKPTEKQVWDTLAKLVELDRLPTLDTHTHQLVKIADELKAMGYLSDVGRVDAWRTAKRENITTVNKTTVLSTLRGSP